MQDIIISEIKNKMNDKKPMENMLSAVKGFRAYQKAHIVKMIELDNKVDSLVNLENRLQKIEKTFKKSKKKLMEGLTMYVIALIILEV